MLTLLISIMMSLNIQYTVVDGRVEISKNDAQILQSSPEYQKNLTDIPLDDIVIVDDTDPASTSISSK